MSIENVALVSAIRDRLLQDCRLAALSIDVRSIDGHVSLIGCVDTIEQKMLTVELIKGMIGVRTVVDNLHVRNAPVITGAIGLKTTQPAVVKELISASL